MSLQASVRYYEHGGMIAKTLPSPSYRRRERSESPKRLAPVKVEIEHPTSKIGIFPDPMKPKLMREGGMTVNEMNNMVMGRHITHTSPIGSLHYEYGGKVPETPATKTVLAEIPTKGVDKVPALLQSGEIVIPKKYATKVNHMMKKEGIYLPNC